MRSASDAKLAKSDDNIDGAIFAVTPIFFFVLVGFTTRRDPIQMRTGLDSFCRRREIGETRRFFFFWLQAKYYFFEIFVFVFLITTKTRSDLTLFST